MKRLFNHRFLLLLVGYALCTSLLYSCSKDDDNDTADTYSSNSNDTNEEPALGRLEMPRVKGGNSVVLVHKTNDSYNVNYCVEWDKDKKAQRWSAYQLNSALCAHNTTRYKSDDNQYPNDPLIHTADRLSEDYIYGSGFDHGHICPSADRLYSYMANYQTFFLTNMQPQYSNFNGSNKNASVNERSPWYRLEGQVRSWANSTTTEMLYVVKGGTIEDHQIIKRIGGKLIVPKYFFVALLLKNEQGYKAVGFWMEHVDSYAEKLPLANYAVNIRQLERLTGIDFFCNLPDDTEEHVETLPIENVKRAWGL